MAARWVSRLAERQEEREEKGTVVITLGLRTVLVLGSPHEVVQPAADEVGIETAMATRCVTVNGRLIGTLRSAPALTGGKQAALLSLAAGQDLSLGSSFAIGNSTSDAKVFDMVGTAIAFEPENSLNRIAATRGWHVADRAGLLELCRAHVRDTAHGDLPC
ncbi:HAD family hydrolase [Streptomyces sp. NPDC059533]|uniref:HAD family hydrolase n=2 Tax=unclassified Streptomyces TaxID=2593676 RepID=UPI0036BC80C9